mmetsp:Transcript_14914/g.22698  ORF Transcript_14914/g.22698 Transcript_14914/m.22698 type:complete len:203 (+) Transcript_14914:112-720(+)
MAGCFDFVPAILALIGEFTCIAANYWCDFVGINVANGSIDVKFGIWFLTQWELSETSAGEVVVYQTCVQYPDSVEFDSSWRSASVFSILAPVLGGICVIMAFIAICANMGHWTWKTLGACLIAVSVFQGLTLLFLRSNVCSAGENVVVDVLRRRTGNDFTLSDCDLDWGGKTCIASVICFFMAGLVSMLIPPPQSEDPDGRR